MRATCPTHLIRADLIFLMNFWGWVQIMKLLTEQLSPLSCHI
jgi:hypothetical protein